MSTRPQLCAQLGMDSQGCSYSAALLVTSVPPVMNPQVSAVRSNRRSPHVVDNPGGSALCRPVDSVEPLCTTLRVDNTVCNPACDRREAPVPGGDRKSTR